MPDLYRHSIETMQAHQAPGGAYVASPNFPTYDYCWFRDGAFTAYAMDVAGQHGSSRSFHGWVTSILLRQTGRVERAIEKARRGEPLGDDYLHTRYTVEGETGAEDWPNFQLDGLSTWLWALAEHVRRGADRLPAGWQTAVDLSARYLAALWSLPCYDLWEEHPQYLHPYTLAAVYAGLRAAAELAPSGQPSWVGIADTIRRVVLRHGVHDGHIVKSMMLPAGAAADIRRPSAVDASLLGASTPYRLLSPEDPLMRTTLACVEADLHRPGGGVYRYQADTYYGGGEWLLLAAWLGWYHAEVGNRRQARAFLHWIEAQADRKGDLPEQVSGHLLAPAYYSEWEARWGPVARPLLWSHAMYVILHHALA